MGDRTNRWTRAESAGLSSTSCPSRGCFPPRQLNRSRASLFENTIAVTWLRRCARRRETARLLDLRLRDVSVGAWSRETPRYSLLTENQERVTIRGARTNRWTRAESAGLSST